MSTDTSIRPVSIKEQAYTAAMRFLEAGEQQDNPHAGTAMQEAWRSAYLCAVLALSAEIGA